MSSVTEVHADFDDTLPGVVRSSVPGTHQSRRKNDPLEIPRQAIRIRRLIRVCIIAELYVLAIVVFHMQNLVDRATLITVAGTVSFGFVALFAVFISGLNQRTKEKNLTAPIAFAGLAVMLWTLYSAPGSRLIFTPFLFVLLAYGMYRLTQRTMLLLSAGALLGYLAIIGPHYLQRMPSIDIGYELLHWLVLALALPGFVVLTGRARRLHIALYQAGIRIRDIEEHARRDPLLGCYNRRYMIAALEEQKRISDETRVPLCLAVIDLDHFKSINDEVGHLAGDEVLRNFACIAQENVRQDDVFGRYGGEEFLLILPATPLLAALNTAERIREQVERHCRQAELRRAVTVSIGLTQYIPGESVLDLFSRTDSAMYLAKRRGRNRVAVKDPSAEPRNASNAEQSA
jgi:diguanylate cyclase (GGDEF)-like protein